MSFTTKNDSGRPLDVVWTETVATDVAISEFRVSHEFGPENGLGVAVMRGKRVSYHTDKLAHGWFEARDEAWLRQFRAVVARLCRSVGHWGIYSTSQDLDSGVIVSRRDV